MKNIFKYILGSLLIFFISCNDGIDGITKVEPGVDQTAPTIKINKPIDGFKLKVPEAIATITIDFEVRDDIEIGSISVAIDGSEIENYSEFKDYRIFMMDDLVYDNVTTGVHTLTVTATDLDGKTTSSSVNFEKTPPYVPLYDGEMFYMPFDGDYNEQITITPATEVGSPTFAGESVVGLNAYKGATDSYITYPTNGLLNSTGFSAAFWYKVSGSPDRAGILVVGDDADNRNQGFRLFREGSDTSQRIKLNVGTGSGESWNDGDVIDVTAGEWVHIAFTISDTQNIIYFNGNPVRTSTMSASVDWTDCETLTIGAGGETFSYWNHKSDNSPMDELRLFDKALTGQEIQQLVTHSSTTLYLPFDGSYTDAISGEDATEVGSPGFATGKTGQAYVGATDSYLTFPTTDLTTPEISATFWYKVNADPDRAGILVIGPPDEVNPDAMNNRKSGFRLFRENASGKQRIKLNVGRGDADTWVDGGTAADIDPTVDQWVFVAFTIATDKATVYIDGNLVKESALSSPVDWTGCDILSVMSGAPRFTGWNHKSDNSLMDELRIYNKALSQEEIQNLMQ
ncbi:MAG: LamG domain-containing protein [Flavobacteriaceae bacterium]|nr:LamG domain-containing protein [Flavobacteriaceae bacterium]